MTECVLVADLGHGSLRAAAIDLNGRVLASDHARLLVDALHPGWVEADPEIWWEALSGCTAEILRALPPGVEVAGVCFTGASRTRVFLDADGVPVRPSILAPDRRAGTEAAEVSEHIRVDNPATRITAFHPIARLAWIARHEPAAFDRMALVLEPKDFLNFRLTGQVTADSVSAARYEDIEQTGALPDRLDRCRTLLALPRTRPWQEVGRVETAAPAFAQLRGVPVFAGSMDVWAAAVGAGASLPGRAFEVAGTSDSVGLVSRRPARSRGLILLPWGDGAYQLGGPTLTGFEAARWACETLAIEGEIDTAIARAAARPPAWDLPVFLPYLAGERAPVWRGDVRGAFHGLGRGHDADDLLWAVLESIGQTIGDVLETAQAATGETAVALRSCGPSSRSDAWCQLKANVLGIPVTRMAMPETALHGCAVAAAVGLGHYPTLAAAADAMCRVDRIFTPNHDHKALFEARKAEFRALKRFAVERADSLHRHDGP